MKDAAIAPGAPAAILEWDFRQDDTKSRTSEYYRIKIFTAEGKKYGDIEIPFKAGFSSIRDLAARTIQPDGTIVPFTGAPFDKLVVKFGKHRYHVKTFSMPQVQPGSIIEYRFTRQWPERWIINTPFPVQREIPVLLARLWLKAHVAQFSSYFTFNALTPEQRPKSNGAVFEAEMKNIPPFEEEPFTAPSDQLKSRLDFYYRDGSVQAAQYWANVAKKSFDDAEKFYGKATAPIDLAGAADDEAKLRRIYDYVRGLRNLSYEATSWEKLEQLEKLQKNANAADVIRHGYGWSSELTQTFVALARANGFEADLVRIGPRDERWISVDVPDEAQLGSEIAVVTYGGKTKYFDPAMPYTAFGNVPWEKTGIQALRLAKGGASAWFEMPQPTVEQAVTKRAANLRLEDDVLRGDVTITFAGHEAQQRRIRQAFDGEAAAKKKLEDELKKMLPEGATAKNVAIDGLGKVDEPLVMKAEIEVAGLAARTGSRVLLPLQLFARADEHPFPSERRKHEIVFPYKFRTEDEVKLTLPQGVSVETLPKATQVDKNIFRFRHSTKSDATTVTMTRVLTVNALSVGVEDYAIVRNFFGTVSTADDEMLILKTAAK